ATPWTPIAWQNQGKWRNWARDRNRNFVDDLIEKQKGKVNVIVDLNGCPGNPATSDTIKYLRTVGDVTYVGRYLTFVVVQGVSVQNCYQIAKRPEVAMVELAVPIRWQQTDYQAAKIDTSTYAPKTLKDIFGWPATLNGDGVNIALVDQGVNAKTISDYGI